MPSPTHDDSLSPCHSGGLVTRAQTDPQNDTAQPPLTSGFGAILEKEHALQTATVGSLGRVKGPRAVEIDRILRHQHARVGANIALLEQRYEARPNSPHGQRTGVSSPHETDLLPDLIARHRALLTDIDALLASAPDGQRGELILTEVRRGHEEMASMLTALLGENESITRPQP